MKRILTLIVCCPFSLHAMENNAMQLQQPLPYIFIKASLNACDGKKILLQCSTHENANKFLKVAEETRYMDSKEDSNDLSNHKAHQLSIKVLGAIGNTLDIEYSLEHEKLVHQQGPHWEQYLDPLDLKKYKYSMVGNTHIISKTILQSPTLTTIDLSKNHTEKFAGYTLELYAKRTKHIKSMVPEPEKQESCAIQ